MPDIDNPYGTFARYSADLSLFLLVADCGQLSRAAELAGLSQPRLSQRMKSLEEALGRVLLKRERRGITLTRAGQELRAALVPHLPEAAAGFARFQRPVRRRTVVIETDLAFAGLRFLPVFPSLCAAFPDLGISLLTRQLPEADPGPEVDLMIRMEPQRDATESECCLFAERVMAVCSPGFHAENPDLLDPAQLRALPLIELTAAGTPPWFTWASWLAQLDPGAGARGGGDRLSFNSYDHVIQAAEKGLGVALGWRGLIDSRLETGALVAALPDEQESPRGYMLRMMSRQPGEEVRAVYDWIRARFTESFHDWRSGAI
ncbi:LysR substrate-binding domain-containing protein [Alloyangia pacifica]|uniref:DNA-binding transcriptional regulator, LysR family n=1 Tax=Alloyangia pacifica TaxID=311180 RepID=A0A1I6RDZ7_9RHOB|nr:LysR substrate-binding domain-containing protein [Alloyangia pacifica]SDG47898.1 DNA-binding transcriptional regulator, LysR family [Alloyangia pacifica]SFS62949.1 DNA-binding transcriptional regulator, LysR family [Alloyangia pacifica]